METGSGLVLGVSEFVEYLNQTLEFAYPYIEIEGELANFRVSRGKWVYFDIKDETASVRCFATVYALPGPLEDGMVVRAAGSPRLHPQYNFSFNVQSVMPVGEGALRRAADLLVAKLEKEGLFDPARKRLLPAVPTHIALVTAGDSAAYADFIKIAAARWAGLRIDHYEVQVQGEAAPAQILAALKQINEASTQPEVVVLIRGGGSADDLAAFSDERVVRAVAASRVPTLVAIGHEVDVSLAELAADMRASTPSNAAELLLPDKREASTWLAQLRRNLDDSLAGYIVAQRQAITGISLAIDVRLQHVYEQAVSEIKTGRSLLAAYDPARPLEQGYALVLRGDSLVTRAEKLHTGDTIEVRFADGSVLSDVQSVKKGAKS